MPFFPWNLKQTTEINITMSTEHMCLRSNFQQISNKPNSFKIKNFPLQRIKYCMTTSAILKNNFFIV